MQNIEDVLNIVKEGPELSLQLDSLKMQIKKFEDSGTYPSELIKIYNKNEPLIETMVIINDGINKFIDNPDEIIGNKWQCEYEIINPILNNAKQTITKVFILNPKNTLVLGVID